jgi:hypothetical protein
MKLMHVFSNQFICYRLVNVSVLMFQCRTGVNREAFLFLLSKQQKQKCLSNTKPTSMYAAPNMVVLPIVNVIAICMMLAIEDDEQCPSFTDLSAFLMR